MTADRAYLDSVRIVGAANADVGYLGVADELALHAQAAERALADAGRSKAEVDGLLSMGSSRTLRHVSSAVGEYLGISPSYCDSTCTGGASFVMMVEHAAAAIHAGVATTCLITYGSSQYSQRARTMRGHAAEPWQPGDLYETSLGLPSPIGAYALAATRYDHVFGDTTDARSEVAIAASEWAALNPAAVRRDVLSSGEIASSPVIATPLRKLDCCLVTDGGGAIVITSADRAVDAPKAPVRVLGAAERHDHYIISQMADLARSPACYTAQRAFDMAGLTPDDVSVAQLYDSFTITVLMTLESMGFCGPGEASDFVSDGRLRPGGAFPMNTQGGGLSFAHPGMFGIFLLTEAVSQLRGEAQSRQVQGADVALCHATGGVFSSNATILLGKD